MPIIVGLLAIGVSHAIDKYQERQAAKNAGNDSNDQDSGFETGVSSAELERHREEEAFRELQDYADFQKTLSSKVLNELSRNDSAAVSLPYSAEFKADSNTCTGNHWYDPLNGTRYTTQAPLSCPIIISQKALGSDGPGWVRTYSPALMDCGIAQEPFLKFLDSFNESLQFYPEIDAVNLAALESGIGWRDRPSVISTAIPNAVQLAKDAQQWRELDTFLDHANLTFFSPRGLFAMVITSNPSDLSPLLTINVVDVSNNNASNLSMQGLKFSDMDRGHTQLTHNQAKQPQASQTRGRRSNKLQKMSNFISEYSDRRHDQPTNPSNNTPLFSLISSISNSRESKKESRKRRSNRFQPARPSSRASAVGSIESAFVTKVGKAPVSTRGILERMRRECGDDTQPKPYDIDSEIRPGALYLVIVNDLSHDQKLSDQGDIDDELPIDVDPSLEKGKAKEDFWYGKDGMEHSLPEQNMMGDLHFEEAGENEEDLPPRYSSIHPQHRARVQAWREKHAGTGDMMI